MKSVFGEELKKILLAGIGAVSVSAEKSKDVIDELVKKGEVTVEQGRVLNEELKRKREEKKKNAEGKKEEEVKNNRMSEVLEALDKMTPEELSKVKDKLSEDKEEELSEDKEEE